ncbi:MAG TPA: GspE/PulE family protein [Candidatus Saccharimonadales bacterium]|nr:GspE/PulE family protein [Candidatus Saccharimonadales bacterium]
MSEDARVSEETNTKKRAGILNLAYVDISQIQSKQLFIGLLTVPQMYDLKIVPLISDQHNVTFGITNNTSQQTLVDVRQRFPDQNVSFVMISDTGYRDYMKLYDPPKQVVYHDIKIDGTTASDSVSSVSLTLGQVNASDMLGYLVEQAHRLQASDIHIETQPNAARVRYRIDGVLHSVASVNLEKYRALVTAIASAGNISTSSNEAQQGHIAQHIKLADGKEVDVNVRLETTPTINGMDIVMRLFNMQKDMFTLDRLGLSEKERAVVDDIIAKPTGLVLVVGPTGSGKTTTLYSILNSLSNDEMKIITVEDPVEYQFPGITQIPVTTENSGETKFAEKLRDILRLDPDIVMIGEIRDMDTAKTALQASLTGHLVLATFHASSAAAALTRLMEVIGQNPLFISSIRLVMAQRLVRRLDEHTKQPYTPDEQTTEFVKSVISGLPKEIPKPDISNLQLYHPGKSEENPFGYKGQIAIREQFLITGEVKQLLLSSKMASTEEIEKAAVDSGMLTILQDGILKAIAGLTTIEELYREIG